MMKTCEHCGTVDDRPGAICSSCGDPMTAPGTVGPDGYSLYGVGLGNTWTPPRQESDDL